MDEDQQLLWFGGLAGAARLGWKAPHFQSPKLTQRLGRITVATLVVRGEQDLLVTERGRPGVGRRPGPAPGWSRCPTPGTAWRSSGPSWRREVQGIPHSVNLTTAVQ